MTNEHVEPTSEHAGRPQLLAGKVALVTGASRGIGAEVARGLADAGAAVAVAACDELALEQLAGEINAAGGRAQPVRTDVTDSASVQALVARTVDELGGLDIAVNNAGGGFAGKAPIGDVSVDEFRDMLELNLTSVFVSMKPEKAALLATGGGAIVNMSSGSGFRAAKGMGPYVTAKHALQGLTKVAALDYAEQGIRINALAPGPIMAGPLAEMGEEFQRMAADSVPMRRIGSPRTLGPHQLRRPRRLPARHRTRAG